LKSNQEYKGRDLYISGVSYGGHYVPAFAGKVLYSKNKDITVKIHRFYKNFTK